MSTKPRCNIVADENIVEAQKVFSEFGNVRTLPARFIVPEALGTAAILLVRSVTRVDETLLKESDIRFVGSATIGTDHVDLSCLAKRGIRFANAPGSNAGSVVEYVIAALLHLESRNMRPLKGRVIGLVGCGNIGGELAKRLPHLGFEVLCNDPPLAQVSEAVGADQAYVSLDEMLDRADILSFHVPLTDSGPFPTRHLLARQHLQQIKPGCTVINTARGAVVDNRALCDALESGQAGAAVLDVWENEPTPLADLIQRTAIATPHIAGYSYDGKLAGTLMLRDALAKFLGKKISQPPVPDVEKRELTRLETKPGEDKMRILQDLVRQAYPISEDDAALKKTVQLSPLQRERAFQDLRRTYPKRYAFERYHVSGIPEALVDAVEKGLKMHVNR